MGPRYPRLQVERLYHNAPDDIRDGSKNVDASQSHHSNVSICSGPTVQEMRFSSIPVYLDKDDKVSG